MDSYWFLITKITQPNPKKPLVEEISDAERQENMEDNATGGKFRRKKHNNFDEL